MMALFL